MSHIKLKAAVIGATGYVGLDLILLLTKHPKIKIEYLCAQQNLGKKISYFDKRIKKKLPRITSLNKVNWNNIDIIFLSLPNGEAQKIIKKLIKFTHVKYIDLSADFRLHDPNDYKIWYGLTHMAKHLIKDSIYSVSEFVKEEIKKYKIVGNPGCYPTSIQLPLIPLIKAGAIKNNNIIIDAKSGYSGAGKNLENKFNHKNIYSSIHAYGIKKHRHMAELDQEFKKTGHKVDYLFSPHLLPTFRGILSTIYVELKKGFSAKKTLLLLKNKHKKNKFIKFGKLNASIGTGNVINTNICEISVCETRFKNKIIIYSALDNLIKGASGQAIQNMNLMYGYKETLGLK